MLKKDYFEAIRFSENKKFNVSRSMSGGYRDKLHWHPFSEILVCLTDRLPVTVNFTTHNLRCNDILIIYPGELHSVPECPEDSLLIIQFPYELLTVMEEFRSRETLFFRTPYIAYDPLKPESHRLVLLLKEFAAAAQREQPFQEMRMYALLLSFFAQAGAHCLRNPGEEPVSEYSSTRQMAEACLFISLNCTRPLMLEDAAGHMGISKSHFAHLFRDFTGMTFLEYLNGERIKHAQSLFRNPDARVIDIAFDSGFSSISSFNRAFKKITGLTPSQYREEIVNQPK